MAKGYDLYSIRSHLLKQFPQTEIDPAIDNLFEEQKAQQIKSYTDKQVLLGFKPEMVRSTLLNQGIKPRLADNALGLKSRPKMWLIIGIAVVIIAIILILTNLGRTGQTENIALDGQNITTQPENITQPIQEVFQDTECSQVPENNKDLCLYRKSESSTDEEFCSQIANIQYRQYCEQTIIVNLMNLYYQQNSTEKVLELNARFDPKIYNSRP